MRVAYAGGFHRAYIYARRGKRVDFIAHIYMRVAVKGLNRNIPREGYLRYLYPVAMWLLSYGRYLATDDVNWKCIIATDDVTVTTTGVVNQLSLALLNGLSSINVTFLLVFVPMEAKFGPHRRPSGRVLVPSRRVPVPIQWSRGCFEQFDV